jgi:hypothetical protein
MLSPSLVEEASAVRWHRHPRPALRRLTSVLLAALLALIALAVVGQAAAALILGVRGLLFFGTAFFTLTLALWPLRHSALHPEVGLTDNGLWLRPHLWPVRFVPRQAVIGLTAHPLLGDRALLTARGRLLHGAAYQPPEGAVVLLHSTARPGLAYRLVALLVGARGGYAFAISTPTHTDYATLHGIIAAWVGD